MSELDAASVSNDGVAQEQVAEPEVKADKTWVGRSVMVTYDHNVSPWYDGVMFVYGQGTKKVPTMGQIRSLMFALQAGATQ